MVTSLDTTVEELERLLETYTLSEILLNADLSEVEVLEILLNGGFLENLPTEMKPV